MGFCISENEFERESIWVYRFMDIYGYKNL